MNPGDPEPPLLTKDEFIEKLSAWGIDVNYRNLEDWQLKGAIPYPVRRRHDGATRAMYPEWMLPMVTRLKQILDEGSSLKSAKQAIGVDANKRLAVCPCCGRELDE